MSAHQCRVQAGASPDAQVSVMQLRTEICLNAGLNCSLCTIFSAITGRMFLLYGLGFLKRLASAMWWLRVEM